MKIIRSKFITPENKNNRFIEKMQVSCKITEGKLVSDYSGQSETLKGRNGIKNMGESLLINKKSWSCQAIFFVYIRLFRWPVLWAGIVKSNDKLK